MVIGGYAVVHYSRPRYTGDLDLWVDASLVNYGTDKQSWHLVVESFPKSHVSSKPVDGGRH